jgi:hypothetical protein
MRKITLLTLTLVSLGILPVAAQLGEVWTDFKSYSTDLQDYFQYNLSDNLRPIESQSRNALNNARGELNIPNPVAAGQKVRDDLINYSYNLDSKANRFENNSAVQGNLVSNELNREITRGAAVGVLGKNGQIRTKTKLESTERSLKDIAKIAEETNASNNNLLNTIKNLTNQTPETKALSSLAELLGLSQVQILKIQQEQVKIVAETFSQSLQNNQSLQYSNLNLANISQQAEETNRARRVETSTEAARLLRATSQIDLFGRKFDK